MGFYDSTASDIQSVSITASKIVPSLLDLVRSKVWYLHACKIADVKTPYQLEKKICGICENRKWGNYLNMKSIPNIETLGIVEAKLTGTSDVFLKGPAGTQLWKVLCDIDLKDLELISKVSCQVDGDIAKLKLDILLGKIHAPHVWKIGTGTEDEFKSMCDDVMAKLKCLVPDDCAAIIMDNLIIPMGCKLYQEEEDKYFDTVVDSKYSLQFHTNETYKEMQSTTIGKKGSGSK